jgi:hypothetical protein
MFTFGYEFMEYGIFRGILLLLDFTFGIIENPKRDRP